MGINDIMEGAVRKYDAGKEYLSPQNLTLAGSIALSTLIGCTDSTTQIDALKQENAALRRELEETKKNIAPYHIPEGSNQVITYETVKHGETFFIRDILAGKVTLAVAVLYKQRGDNEKEIPWDFRGVTLTGETDKSFGVMKTERGDLSYHRFTSDGRVYMFVFKDLPDGSIKVASCREGLRDRIDLKRVYGER